MTGERRVGASERGGGEPDEQPGETHRQQGPAPPPPHLVTRVSAGWGTLAPLPGCIQAPALSRRHRLQDHHHPAGRAAGEAAALVSQAPPQP